MFGVGLHTRLLSLSILVVILLFQGNICQAVLFLLPELDQDSLREVQCKIGELLRE